MPKIKEITCHKVVNSRGEWTLDTKVVLDDGFEHQQTIPDGASKGEHEAVYIDTRHAVSVVSTVLNDSLKGMDAYDQSGIDREMIELDGTPNKKHLGGNSILSVSLAVAAAAAKSKGLELYQYISELYSGKALPRKPKNYPIPVFNILNGGKHADNGLSFQEFMVIPAPGTDFEKCMEIGVNVYQDLKKDLKKAGFETGVGDEGGFAPENMTVKKALTFIRDAASKRYRPGKDLFFGMDVAAESFWNDHGYSIKEENLELTSEQLGNYYKDLLKEFELIYLEDPFYENDREGWKRYFADQGNNIMVVADDLVVTNPKFLKKAIKEQLANSVIVKYNQVGTLTETLEFIKMAKDNGMQTCVSHRSGDTAEDTFLADLAIGVGSEFMKAGAPVRGERVVKYNRLLDIYADF